MTDLRIEEFLSRLRTRLYAGARTYGDTSFGKPVLTTVYEIEQELEDVAGWAFIMWVQMRTRLAKLVEAADRLDSLVSTPSEPSTFAAPSQSHDDGC